MPSVARRLVHAALAASTLMVAVASGPAPFEVASAHADDEAPIAAGVTLVARGDCELRKVTITRGARVQVTASTATNADIALPDGHVLRRISMSQLRYFFDVAR